MNYHPWTDDRSNDSYALVSDVPKELKGKDHTLVKGISVRDWFPSDVVFDFALHKGIKSTDSIPNNLGMHIISEKLRHLLEISSGARFEFLPVRLRDHKKKVLLDTYYLANLLDVVPCVDRARSDFSMNKLIRNEIRRFRKLVLDTNQLKLETRIFRLGERPRLIIVREDLARDIVAAGCTGMQFITMEDFGAEFRPQTNYDI
ncbi:DUF1629 domain-containing protein (plasmid) [Leptospira sp. WS60.C2]